MVTLEQVKLLDQRITRTIEHVKKVTDENALLKGKQDSYKKRINELEKTIQQFKDDQGQIEEKFLSAFNRLDEIEDALGNTVKADDQSSLQASNQLSDQPSDQPSNLASLKKKAEAAAPVTEMYDTPEAEEAENELDIF